MVRTRAMRTLENACRRLGFVRVAGVDEVGRGCLAGPVVAGAVVLDPDCHIPGLSDSKQVPAAERERLYDAILRRALGWSVASADRDEIDAVNIHQASLNAMRRAVLGLAPLPDLVLVDAFYIPDLFMAQRGVLHGDARCAAIAAGSIVAKVTRDRLMLNLHLSRPALRLRSAQGLRDRRPSCRRCTAWLLRRPPPLLPAHTHCLIAMSAGAAAPSRTQD